MIRRFLHSMLTPALLDQLGRFRKEKRAWVSLWFLLILYVVSLFAGVIANGTPWKVKTSEGTYFPWVQRVTQNDLLGDGVLTPPDYHSLSHDERFTFSWTLIPYGPKDTLAPDQIDLPDEVRLTRERVQRVGYVQLNSDGKVLRVREGEFFFGEDAPDVPESIQKVLELRFKNLDAPAQLTADPSGRFEWSISGYEPRKRAPRSARVLLRELLPPEAVPEQVTLDGNGVVLGKKPVWYDQLPESVVLQLADLVKAAMHAPVEPVMYTESGSEFRLRIERETVQFPFRPIAGHAMGLDESGRDVLVLILYATQIALSFGFLLVICSILLGTVIGGLQGYYGGWWDLVAQRLIEVYESIPFLYVMIFLGSVFGRSFGLLLAVYAMFNWVGISYYLRAEYLRGRKQDYAEAARALGLPDRRVMWRHILPNSLVPLITLFPFMLVGAIGSLNALDYLGFGMPVGTPSWGDLLRQAQRYRYAWWLITYPSLALFTVILLGVFVGEGLRAAFDPKRATRWEA